MPAPTVTAVSPNSGTTAGGTSVTITGTNLTGATAVTFGGTPATNIVVVNSTTITAVTPPHAANSVHVAVTTPGGTGSASWIYTYIVPVPTITSVSPSSGSTLGGDLITITGTNFTGATAVTFGGIAATNVTVVNSTTVTAVTRPRDAGTVDARVYTSGGWSTGGTGLFTYAVDPPIPEYVLSGTFNGQPVQVSANTRFGGAIYSLKLNGFEFLDSSDHGRELQTAWQLDGQGEGQNPTEAGSSSDGGQSSTDVLEIFTNGTSLYTRVKPAYWLTYNGQVTSPHILEKTVTLGAFGKPNVLRHNITAMLNEPHTGMAMEGLTGYLTPTFTRFWMFNRTTGVATEVFPGSNQLLQSANPVIVTSADLTRAIGFVHDNPNHFYWIGKAAYIFTQIPKIDGSWFSVSGPSGWYTWTTYTVFGTFEEVKAAALALP